MDTATQKYFQFSPYRVDGMKVPGFNWEKFQDKIDTLPDNLYSVLVDENTINFIKSLTQKYIQLSVQGPDVARIIRDIVIGDVFIGDMPQEIARRLGIDPALAREIANQIVSQLFQPVLVDIKRVQAARFPNRIAQKVFGPSSPPQGPPSVTQHPAANSPQPRVTPPPPRQTSTPMQHNYQGEGLPESGGNVIDLRQK